MPNYCKACRHPELKSINTRLIEGSTLEMVATEFNLTKSCIYNHKKMHLSKSLTRLFQRKEKKMNGELVELAENIEQTKLSNDFDIESRFKFLVDETLQIFEIAKQGGQSLTALKSLDSLRNSYGLIISVLDKLEASKKLELEILKAQQGEGSTAKDEKYYQDLKILNFEELEMWERLWKKLQSQSKELLILDGKVRGWIAPLKFPE